MDVRDDVVAVEFQHHHVAVAADADILKAHEIGLSSRLVQPLGDAGVKDAVIGAVRRDRQHRHVGEADQLTRRLLLQVARHFARLIPLFFEIGHKLGRIAYGRIVGQRVVDRTPRIGRSSGVGDLGGVDAPDLRAAGLYRDQGLYEIRYGVGHAEADTAALGVRQQDNRTDLLKQFDRRMARQRRALASKLHLGLDEVVENGIARLALARPLGVVVVERENAHLFHVGPDGLQLRRCSDAEISVLAARKVGRTPARRVVHHVQHVALLQHVVGPARTPVRRLLPVHARLAVAVEEHDRIGLGDLGRLPDIDVHLPAHHRRIADVVAADVVGALAGEVLGGEQGDGVRGHRYGGFGLRGGLECGGFGRRIAPRRHGAIGAVRVGSGLATRQRQGYAESQNARKTRIRQNWVHCCFP